MESSQIAFPKNSCLYLVERECLFIARQRVFSQQLQKGKRGPVKEAPSLRYSSARINWRSAAICCEAVQIEPQVFSEVCR